MKVKVKSYAEEYRVAVRLKVDDFLAQGVEYLNFVQQRAQHQAVR